MLLVTAPVPIYFNLNQKLLYLKSGETFLKKVDDPRMISHCAYLLKTIPGMAQFLIYYCLKLRL